MRFHFHESDFLLNCQLLSHVEKVHRQFRSLDCEYLLVKLPDGHENMGKATHSD